MKGKGKLLKVSKIKKGTVVDHITRGRALDVCKILGIFPRTGETVTIAMNVKSQKMSEGEKDILKIEGRNLDPSEVHKIAIISPEATINIIRNYAVIKKEQVQLPKEIIGMIKCPKPTCISNNPTEPIRSKFLTRRDNNNNLSFQCHYCGQIIDSEDLAKSII